MQISSYTTFVVKFMFSKNATKIDKIFTVNLTVTTYCQIDGEDFVNFCGLLRKRELYCVLFSQKRAEELHWVVILVGCAVSGMRTKKNKIF